MAFVIELEDYLKTIYLFFGINCNYKTFMKIILKIIELEDYLQSIHYEYVILLQTQYATNLMWKSYVVINKNFLFLENVQSAGVHIKN